MVKRVSHPVYAKQPKKRLRWWRGLVGALLTGLIVVPYMMGMDVEKYLRDWLEASNQSHGSFHFELQNYQRHWFTSESDLLVRGGPLHDPLLIHLKAYHGPLFLNAGHGLRFGLGFVEGSLDTKNLLSQQDALKLIAPIQVTAFIPYFSDREIHTYLPPLTLTDKSNSLIYNFKSLEGSIDGDGLLQLEVPSLEINHLNGSKAAELTAGVLRLLPRNELASFSAKQLNIYNSQNKSTTVSNLVLQANTQNITSATGLAELAFTLRFDEAKGLLDMRESAEPLDLGPFEFQLKISGLQSTGLNTLVESLKILSLQESDLTPEQGEKLEKAWSSIFSATTVFKLSSKLSTSNGPVTAEFQGGFLKESFDLADSFYSKGSVKLSNELRDALSKYLNKPERPQDAENISLMLDYLKQDGQGYITTIDVHQGRILFNGKDLGKK